MTGFALFQDNSKFESFQCSFCDSNFITAKAAAVHIQEYHISDGEDEDSEVENEDEDIEVENEDDELFVLEECADPFAKMHKWMDSKSIFSHEYEQWKKAFGHAECPFCSSIFASKIAWIHHIVANHDIDPEKSYLCDSKMVQSAHSLKSIFDDIPVSSSGENYGNIEPRDR